jgi:hypothetical protein
VRRRASRERERPRPVEAREGETGVFFAVKIATMSGVAEVATTVGTPCAARLKQKEWVSPRGDTCGDTRKPPETMLNVRGCARVVLEVGSNLVQQTRLKGLILQAFFAAGDRLEHLGIAQEVVLSMPLKWHAASSKIP